MATNKIFLILFIGIFFISFVNAEGIGKICIDVDPPSAPLNLAVSGEVGNIILSWNAATDIPACSGISHYVISRNGNDNEIGKVNGTVLSFVDKDNLSPGSYNYTVYAVDKVGHNKGASIRNDIILSQPSKPSGGGGGGGRVTGGGAGTSYICEPNWQCSDWSACVNGQQTRTCTDIAECGTDYLKPETLRACSEEQQQIQEITPTGQGITGAVIGFVKSPTGIITIFTSLIAIAGAFIVIKLNLLKRK